MPRFSNLIPYDVEAYFSCTVAFQRKFFCEKGTKTVQIVGANSAQIMALFWPYILDLTSLVLAIMTYEVL